MKYHLTKLGFLAAVVVLLVSQFNTVCLGQTSAKALGEITYFEGRVKLSVADSNTWAPVSLHQSVYDNQSIKTSFESAVEIKWINGSKSSIGARTQQNIASLYGNSSKNVKSKTESIWGNFLALFSEKSSESQEEGGIRRSQVLVEDTSEDDFSFEEEMTFEKCSKLYETKSYLKAVNAFTKFLSQQPNHPKAPFALFAKGHCYIEMNNLEKARETYQDFIVKYPNHSLAKSANDILQKL